MSIQYLLVTFGEQRGVLADGVMVGVTNHILMLPSDEYQISLDGTGYTPGSQGVSLDGTSVVKPLVIAFTATALEITAAERPGTTREASPEQTVNRPPDDSHEAEKRERARKAPSKKRAASQLVTTRGKRQKNA
jgi:hypothetical protein